MRFRDRTVLRISKYISKSTDLLNSLYKNKMLLNAIWLHQDCLKICQGPFLYTTEEIF
jgi:hypothetical protein